MLMAELSIKFPLPCSCTLYKLNKQITHQSGTGEWINMAEQNDHLINYDDPLSIMRAAYPDSLHFETNS
jgi:hypothetical protein